MYFKLGEKTFKDMGGSRGGAEGAVPTIFLRNFVLLFFKNSE